MKVVRVNSCPQYKLNNSDFTGERRGSFPFLLGLSATDYLYLVTDLIEYTLINPEVVPQLGGTQLGKFA